MVPHHRPVYLLIMLTLHEVLVPTPCNSGTAGTPRTDTYPYVLEMRMTNFDPNVDERFSFCFT